MNTTNKSTQFPREAYLADGRRVRALGMVADRYIVELGQLGVYGDEEHLYFDGLSLEAEIFDAPPTAAVDTVIRELLTEEDNLRQRVNALRDELRAVESEHTSRLGKLQSFSALRHVENFLEGRFTHAVMAGYSNIDIVTFEEALQPDKEEWGRREKGLKLLTLFGETKGNLQWRINQYKDGSGINIDVWLCMSMGEAKEIAQRLINERCAEAVRDKRSWVADGARKAAQKFGLAIPQDLADMHAEHLRNTLQSNVAKARKDLENAEHALRQAQG